MGYVFEELIRKFNEENNEEAGGVTSRSRNGRRRGHFNTGALRLRLVRGSGNRG
jgi:hypothetical protein